MVDVKKYNFSFTGLSLRVKDLFKVAYSQENNLEFDALNELGGGKSSTTKKLLNEINKRLKSLTKEQKSLFVQTDFTTQKQIAILAMSKSHGFIRDFIIEVLREKVLVFDYQITEGEYLSFFRRKTEEHPELVEISELSQYKIKQVLFRSLEEAGFIDNIKSRQIQVQLLDDKLIKLIAKDNKQWLKIFFMSDIDIENVNA